MVNVLESVPEARLNESPRTGVFVLLLWPSNLCIFVEVKLFDKIAVRERGELFDSDDGDIFPAKLFSFSNQVIVDLTRAKDNLSDVSGFDFFISLADNFLEVMTWSELLNVWTSFS